MLGSKVLAHLRNDHASVVIVSDGGMPEICYWGAPLGTDDIDPVLFVRPIVGGGLDVDPPVGIVAESSRGWFGRPGIEGCRSDGRDSAPRFELTDVASEPTHVGLELVDPHARLRLDVEVRLASSGVVALDSMLTNQGDDDFDLAALRLTLPVPDRATELMTLGGRHLLEFVEHRTPWAGTCLTVENRHGKTSHERLGVVVAGTQSFGEQIGEVWGCHVGWSGNYELICDSITDGRRVVQAGELLLPGEVSLAPGETHRSPTVYGAYSGTGLNAMSNSFHEFLRSRPSHPRSPRPIHLNTWEAVYFEHDLATMLRLADAAAAIGIERFVLDDGWFGGRRDDARGLGDWWVSSDAWPDGLTPIIDHVRGLGMEFGIWVEPEMVNVDSDLYRTHPDWALVDPRYPAVLGRNQLVLDVGRPDVRDHLFDELDRLLRDHDIAYVKWDHNRDLPPAAANGVARARRQALGFYELLDRLRDAHPGVEFETCASGGGRVDFGVLERTDRVWTSDSIDALDRLAIQRGFSLLFPPELMGSHIGAPVAHATLRHHRLGFRAAAAIFGAFGIEWNLLDATPSEREQLADLIALHRRFRPLLHSGNVVRCDHPDPTVDIHGVVATDQSEALIVISRLASGPSHHTAPIRLPYLADDTHYELVRLDVAEPLGRARRQPNWVDGELTATGRQLREAGFRAPQLVPESALLLHLTTTSSDT